MIGLIDTVIDTYMYLPIGVCRNDRAECSRVRVGAIAEGVLINQPLCFFSTEASPWLED
jgi:hypothetical protein